MNERDSEKLRQQLAAQVKYQTRWLRRPPLLLGAIGLVLMLIGYWRSSGSLTTLGACVSVMGFGAQAVLWYGLRGEDK
jgi:hypothetical protein